MLPLKCQRLKGVIMAIDTRQPIGKAIQDENWPYLCQRINRRFDCNISVQETESVFSIERKKIINESWFGGGWSDSTWVMWLKNRIRFRCGSTTLEDTKWNELHVFFIGIPEDLNMIGNLRDSSWFPEDSTARSRISKSQLSELNPINRTAWLVTDKAD